ncbi:MAG TPA: FAD binding domain-containing protein [Ktedonobacterales bacterium]|jgi:carbon-monoxide dehydrogenase medium subunit
MLLNVTEYYRPDTLEEALQLLRRPGVKTVPLAGGTLLVGQRDDSVQAVVDLKALGHNTIQEQQGRIHLGAMVTLQQLVESQLAQEIADGILAKAAKSSAARLIRNAATVGGTLAAGPAAHADLAVALAALGAQVHLVGVAERSVPVEEVFAQRQSDELLTEINFHRPAAHAAGAFLRVARAPDDVALVHVAALVQMEGGVCQRIHLAVGGVGMSPVRLDAAETVLYQQAPDETRIAAAVSAGLADFNPPPDFRASPEYRKEIAGVLARRALQQCADAARWKQLMGNQGS